MSASSIALLSSHSSFIRVGISASLSNSDCEFMLGRVTE